MANFIVYRVDLIKERIIWACPNFQKLTGKLLVGENIKNLPLAEEDIGELQRAYSLMRSDGEEKSLMIRLLTHEGVTTISSKNYPAAFDSSGCTETIGYAWPSSDLNAQLRQELLSRFLRSQPFDLYDYISRYANLSADLGEKTLTLLFENNSFAMVVGTQIERICIPDNLRRYSVKLASPQGIVNL